MRSASVDLKESVAASERRRSKMIETGVLSTEMQCLCADIIVVGSEKSVIPSESTVIDEYLDKLDQMGSTFGRVSRIG